MSKIQEGSKVVCIDDEFNNPRIHLDFTELPVKGKIYTVREIIPVGQLLKEKAGLLLVEIKNNPIYFPDIFGKREPGFSIDRFVPITDYEIAKLEEEVLLSKV